MDLLLWRHADAVEGQPDSARPLTPRGLSQARAMAQWLEPRLPKDLRILVSPAKRAQQTAVALCGDFETRDELAPGMEAAALIRAAGWPDSKRAVMLVGHQPTLGEVAAELLAGRAGGWRIAKGALWWLRRRGRGDAVLLLAIEPDLLAGAGGGRQ